MTFAEVSYVIDTVIQSAGAFDVLRLQYNHYINMVQSKATDTRYLNKEAFVEQRDLLYKYDFEGGLKDEEVMADLYDFLIAGAAYGAIMENQV